jgi:hypothetical protein
MGYNMYITSDCSCIDICVFMQLMVLAMLSVYLIRE